MNPEWAPFYLFILSPLPRRGVLNGPPSRENHWLQLNWDTERPDFGELATLPSKGVCQ